MIAGPVNLGDHVLLKVTGNNTVDEIAGMVEEVTHSKAKAERTADEIAKWIVLASAMLGMLTFVIWCTVDMTYRKESTGSAITNAIPYAISEIVACYPCDVVLLCRWSSSLQAGLEQSIVGPADRQKHWDWLEA